MNPMPNTIETSFAGTPNTFPQPINSTRQDLFSQSFPSNIEVIQMPDGGPDTMLQDKSVDFVNLDADEIDFASSIEIPQTEFSDANPLNNVFEQFEPTSDLTDENIILENPIITEPTETPEIVDVNLDSTSEIPLETTQLDAENNTESILDQTQRIETDPIIAQLKQDALNNEQAEVYPELNPSEYTQITQALYNIPDIINNAIELEKVTGPQALTFKIEEISSLIGTTSNDLLDVMNYDVIGAPNPLTQPEVKPFLDQPIETILNNLVEKSERILQQKAQLLDLSNALSHSQDLSKSSEQLSLAINASIANATRIVSLPEQVKQEILNLNPGSQAYQDVKTNLTTPTENSIELIIASLNANKPELKFKKEIIILEMVTKQYKFELMELVENFDSAIRISPDATDEEVQNLRSIYLDVMREISLESQDKTKSINFEEIYERMLKRIEKEKDKLPKDFAISFVYNGQLFPLIRGDQSFVIFEPNISSDNVNVELLRNNKEYGFYTRKDLLQDVEEGKQHSSVLPSGKILTISSETDFNLSESNQQIIIDFYRDLVSQSKSSEESSSKYNNAILKHSIDINGQPVQFIESWITNPFKKVVVRDPKSREIYNEYGQSA